MQLKRIQYITHPKESFDDLSWVHRLKENGVDWIQLRMKEEDFIQLHPRAHFLVAFHEIAFKMRAITLALGIKLTINDLADVAFFSDSDGLHVGQTDEWPDFAELEGKIIGGTAHNLEEMKRFPLQNISYFGVGPMRETTTKDNTKVPLGIEGYRRVLQQMRAENIEIPVFAIGGINPEDVPDLLNTGVYGIAISGAIFHNGHSGEAIRAFSEKIKEYEAQNS